MLASLFTSSGQAGSPSEYYYDYIFIILIVFIAVRRLSRGIHGRVYSRARVLRVPVVYSLLSIFLLSYIVSDLIYTAIAVLMIIPGLIAGMKFGSLSTVYEQNGQIMYRRSAAILAIWMILFILRVYTEIFVPADLLVNFTIDAFLILSLGLLIGEAYHLVNKYNELMEQGTGGNGASSTGS